MACNSKIRLFYFPITGFAEPVRYLLAYLGKDYEDHRFGGKEWLAVKRTTPWGKAPVLEINGQTVTQNLAICRYLGKEAGLCGKDSWEDLRIDEIVDVSIDFLKGRVGVAIAVPNIVPLLPDSAEDIIAAYRFHEFLVGLFTHPVFSSEGNYPTVVRERVDHNSKLEGRNASRLPPFTPEEIQYITVEKTAGLQENRILDRCIVKWRYKYGMWYVDFNNTERPRTKKLSAYYFKELAKNRELPEIPFTI